MQKYTTENKRIYWGIASFASLMIAMVLFAYSFEGGFPQNYFWIWLLPLTCCVCYAMCAMVNSDRRNSVSCLMILAVTFVRYCLHPLIMVIGDFQTLMKLNLEQNSARAIFLMAYEIIAIFATVLLWLIYSNQKQGKVRPKKKILKMNVLGIILLVFVIFCVAVALFVPNTMKLFKTILQLADSDFTMVTYSTAENQVGSMARILQTLFSMIFDFLRIMLPLWLMYLAKKKKAADWIIFLIALVFSVLQFFFITSTFAESIVSTVIILLIAAKLCPKQAKMMIGISAIAAVGIIVLFFTVRYGNTRMYASGSALSYVCNVLNAYVGGIDNVAATFNLPTEQKWSTLFFNLYGAIPFNSTLFGLTGEKLQGVYNFANNSYGQIVPTLGSSWYYFGTALAPLFTVILTFFALKFDWIADKTEYYWKTVAYKFASIVFVLGIAMYSETIVLSWFTSWILPIIILACFSTDRTDISEADGKP